MPDAARARRIARNEAAFREVNDRLDGDLRRLPLDGPQQFLCECGTEECEELVEVTFAQYEEVRRNPLRFLVRPGHVFEDVERVVAHHPGYEVIEKVAGQETALRTDPRRAGGAA